SQTPSIAFIGLGIMGLPMAANLVKAGYQLTAYDLNPDSVAKVSAQGGKAAESVAEAVRDADIVITMVPDSPDVEAVLLNEDGVFANAASGALIIDMSTIRPDVARSVSEEGAKRGLRVLDAPVSGGEAGAIEAKLSIMVGGD